jgi:LytR cell envelope-related transcriptional attenuator
MVVRPPLPRDLEPRGRRFRRLRTAITMLALVGLVAGATWYAWQTVTEPTEIADEPVVTTPVCAVPVPEDPPPPEEINVNVYNGTNRSGLANQVAREMREIGFVTLDVANDPLGRSVTGVAEIRAATQDENVTYIMSQFPGSVFLADERKDETIDVVLGQVFESVGPQGDEPDPESTNPPIPPC